MNIKCFWAHPVWIYEELEFVSFELQTTLLVGHSVHRIGCIFSSSQVNQHPPMHRLVALSIGWVAFFHPTSISTFFGFWSMSFFWGCFFSQPWPSYYFRTKLPYWPSYPVNLHFGPTYQQTIEPSPTYLVTFFFSLTKVLPYMPKLLSLSG